MCLFAEVKIGTVDTQEVFTLMPELKTAQASLEEVNKRYQTEYKSLQDEFNKKLQEYQALSKDASTPENIKQRREQELNELGQKIQTFEQVANQDIQQQQQKLMAPIYEKINTAIKAVGDENGYTYILEDSQVIYKNPTANDVTPLVKAKLNLKDAPARAEALAAELKETAKQLDILKAQVAASKIDGLFEDAADVDGVRIVSAYLTGTGADTLRDMVDKVRDKAPNAVTVLIGSDGAKTMMAVGVSKNAMARGLKAGALVKKIAAIAGGKGGGKPDFAMAGLKDETKIDEALAAVSAIVKKALGE